MTKTINQNKEQAVAPSLSQIAAILPKDFRTIHNISFEIGEAKIPVAVNPVLSLKDYVSFVHHVSTNVFVDEAEPVSGVVKKVYNPALKEIAIARAIFAFYTNLEIDTDIETTYYIITTTDLLEKIIELINKTNKTQFEQLFRDVVEDIQARQARLDNTNPLASMMDMFSLITENISEQVKQPEFLKQYIDETLVEQVNASNGKD